MTKYHVTVCLPPRRRRWLPFDPWGAIDAAMRPFDRDANDIDDVWGCWDWYQVGSDDTVVCRPEHDGDRRLLWRPVESDGKPRPRGPLRCDGGPRGLLDLERIREISVDGAAATWAVWERFAAEHPPAEPLSVFLARHAGHADRRCGRKLARQEHLAQPLVQALAQHAVLADDPHYPNSFVLEDPVELFGVGRDAWLAAAAACSLPTFGLLTLDGRWVNPHAGDLPGDPLPGESRTDAYWRLADAYLRGLADDVVIAHVLIHC